MMNRWVKSTWKLMTTKKVTDYDKSNCITIVEDSFNRFRQISCNRIVKVKVVLKFDFILNITTLHQYLYRFLNTYTRTQKNKKTRNLPMAIAYYYYMASILFNIYLSSLTSKKIAARGHKKYIKFIWISFWRRAPW